MRSPRLLAVARGAIFAVALQVGVARAELKKQWIDYNDGSTPLYGWRRACSDVSHAAGRAVARSHPTSGCRRRPASSRQAPRRQ